MTTTLRTATLALATGALALALTACATPSPAPTAAAPTAAAATAAPAAVTEPAPAASASAPAPSPAAAAPAAGPYDQVINGTLYTGTALAPVRIGTDAPGQPPAAEAGFQRNDGWKDYVRGANKYAISVAASKGGEGWYWKIFAVDDYGVFGEVANSYSGGSYLPSREAAVGGPFVVDGRPLDRAEYILVVN